MARSTSALLLLLLLSLLPLIALAQKQPNSYPPPPPPPPPSALTPRFNAPMAVIIAVLITAFFFMGFFSVYIRQCGSHSDPSTATRLNAPSRSRRAALGLDPSIISSFPTLVYSDVKQLKLGKNTLECAVCLSDFDDLDTLRLLPHCSHAFHPDCIDTWLSSHTTCPVCRHNLTAPQPQTEPNPDNPPEPVQPEQVTIPVEPNSAAVTDAAPEEERSLSRRFRVPSLWRSRTTARPYWAEAERERFTLRLPEHVRREVMAGKLRRSVTMAAFPQGEGSARRGYRGEGSSRGGWSFKLRREWAAKSDRWAFLARPLSFKFSKTSGDGDRSIRAGEGSSKEKASSSMKSTLDCLGGGAAASKGGGSGGEEDHTARV